MEKELFELGWQKKSMGTSSHVNYDDRFQLYVRRRNLTELRRKKMSENEDFFKKSSNTYETSYHSDALISGLPRDFSQVVSQEYMGSPEALPTPPLEPEAVKFLPQLSDLGDYQSLQLARTGQDALVIAYDSEWYYEDDKMGDRIILSYQFALIDGNDLVEYVFLPVSSSYRLSAELSLGVIFDDLNKKSVDIRKVRKYAALSVWDAKKYSFTKTLYDSYNEAKRHSIHPFKDGKQVKKERDWSSIPHMSVVLLCHAGKGDISAFDQTGKYHTNILKLCTEVQDGLISLKPFDIYPNSMKPIYSKSNNTHSYPISLQVADTMCHAPAKMKSLKDLGQTIHWEKIDVGTMIDNMNVLLQTDPCSFFEYASNDSVVTLLYAASLYGYNQKLPVTVTSATAKVMKTVMMNYLHVDNTAGFDRVYRGLEKVGHGLVTRDGQAGFISSTSLEPISDKVHSIQLYASYAYHGGYNSSSEIGYFTERTYDFDLENAYPTAMCLVPDVDWENPVRRQILDREMSLADFQNTATGEDMPLEMFVGYIRFEFPDTVKYPCIPVNIDGILVFPLSSEGMNGVYACGPEVYLALKLGAKVYCESGYFLNPLRVGATGYASYSLRCAVNQMVKDRRMAQQMHGKKSLEELILKTMVNSGYGKIAQNVVEKNKWSAYKDEMENIGCSAITNPVSACLTTSIVRAELLAAQNECSELGYKTYSVTTDGFISDIPEKELKTLQLYGFRPFMEQARLFLTDGIDSELWVIKHTQDDLVNFTTRGNISLQSGGVCAHNSTKSIYPSESYEDRLWLMKSVISRTGPVMYTSREWTSFKELVREGDLRVKDITKSVSMDYDMKRKPVRDSFVAKDVPLEGATYEIINFTTIPFETIQEAKNYREHKENVQCLRTQQDWDLFYFKMDSTKNGARVKDMEWSILFSVILGHRAGLWRIPQLDLLEGEERCAWINTHNTSPKRFTRNDWKNAGRGDRQANILPRHLLQDKIDELINNNHN